MFFIGCFLLLVFAVSAGAVDPVGLSILYPSDENAVIAPGRDFYVVGKISGVIPERGQLSVTVNRVGSAEPVRTVYSNLKNDTEGILANHPDLSGSSDTDLISKSQMPDLAYSPANLDSIRDVWRKCTYDDHNFSALISGGRYRSDLRLVDEQGKTLYPLEPGDYDIVVTLKYRSRTLAQVSKRISLGISPSKAIARLEPAEHASAVKADTKAKGITLYTDPMPGYWEPRFLDAFADKNLFLEIPARWHQALRAEYARGFSNLYLYNISSNCAAQTVVLGLLQQQGVIESPERLRMYYYDIGEPSLPYLPERASRLLAVPQGKRLVLTRAEITDIKGEDNFYDPESPFSGTLDFNPTNGVSAQSGQYLSVYGVVTPIQNALAGLIETPDHRVAVPNRIATVFYSVIGSGFEYYFDLPVQLTRRLEGRDRPSVYEFKHIIPITDAMVGKRLLVTLEGVDTHGAIVANASQNFSLTVAPAEISTPTSPDSIDPKDTPANQTEFDDPDLPRVNPPTGWVLR